MFSNAYGNVFCEAQIRMKCVCESTIKWDTQGMFLNIPRVDMSYFKNSTLTTNIYGTPIICDY